MDTKFIVIRYRQSDEKIEFDIRDRVTKSCDNTFALSIEGAKNLIVNLQDLIARNE